MFNAWNFCVFFFFLFTFRFVHVPQSPLEVRLVGGRERRAGMEGRVEVRRFGVWGTVCDDDFSANEALVICNNLGFKGSAEVSTTWVCTQYVIRFIIRRFFYCAVQKRSVFRSGEREDLVGSIEVLGQRNVSGPLFAREMGRAQLQTRRRRVGRLSFGSQKGINFLFSLFFFFS